MARASKKIQLRDRVVAAALNIAVREGEASLSMRRVAAEADCALSSVYRVVTDRDDLLSAMLDQVAAAMTHPPIQSDPEAEIVAIFTVLREAIFRNPWAIDALAANDRGSLHVLPLIERIFLALRKHGLKIEQARDVYRALIAFTFGDVLIEIAQARGGTSPSHRLSANDLAEFDALNEAMQAKPYGRTAFGENLKRIMRGSVTIRKDGTL